VGLFVSYFKVKGLFTVTEKGKKEKMKVYGIINTTQMRIEAVITRCKKVHYSNHKMNPAACKQNKSVCVCVCVCAPY